MNTVTVRASRQYDVLIGSGILRNLGSHVKNIGGVEKVCIVSDSNVWPLYGDSVAENLKDAGFQTCSFVFPAGEDSKNAETFLALLNMLAQQQLTRTDLLVALGGGVVGDLTGFAASCYLRGVPFLQIPTTLLAAVDSSVGGKTAIDLPAGKNLAGAFYQPWLVLCDTDTLKTLPDKDFRDGCAEVIKYAVLYDPELFSELERSGLSFHRERIITRCVTWKRDVVAEDEFDTGSRMKLNLGHTLGHGVEAASNFAVSHGQAVAIGMAMVARAANCPDGERIIRLLEIFGLPTSTSFTPEELYAHALSDKKRSGSTLRIIVPNAIGNCAVESIPAKDFLSFIQKGL